MDNLVFLKELDSTRNTDREILVAQEALFEAIVMKGDIVVITFNQLTDSMAFTYPIETNEYYDEFISLLRMGKIRISRFGKLRTASQYMQRSLEKCIEDNKVNGFSDKTNTFIFSGLPIKRTDNGLLEIFRDALKYSDPGILDEYKDDEGKPLAKARRDYLWRFINLLLEISKLEEANNPPKVTSTPDINVYDYVMQNISEYVSQNENCAKSFTSEQIESAARILRDSRKYPNMPAKNPGRSDWYDYFLTLPEDEEVLLAEAIIDMSYNFTLERSINGIHLDYEEDSLMKHFVECLDQYWKEYKEIPGFHTFHKEDDDAMSEKQKAVIGDVVRTSLELPHWDTAVRLLREIDELRKKNKLKLTWSEWMNQCRSKRISTVALYVITFAVVQYIANLIQGLIEDFIELLLGGNGVMHVILVLICNLVFPVLIFGLITSLLSEKLGLVDILESFRMFSTGIKDQKILKRFAAGERASNRL